MNTLTQTVFPLSNPAIAILGVPFDNLTTHQALARVEQMVASGKPHYFVTPNVDFLTQARTDTELRRILCDAHLVLCDGTPVVWASRFLGNPLPERVAGSDMVPLLINLAAEKNLRLFFLGGTPGVMELAIEKLKATYPTLNVSGYSPPFGKLMEMNNDEIKRRIAEAKPDMLFVSFGCPKQEKWISMHYKSLGVPVVGGVGGTIDFLAGHTKRAPRWMQRTGTEWLFRLAQEPRRLFRRYALDLRVFAIAIFAQWWQLQFRSKAKRPQRSPLPRPLGGEGWGEGDSHANTASSITATIPPVSAVAIPSWHSPTLPSRLDFATVRNELSPSTLTLDLQRHCLLPMEHIEFVDSTGMGWLIRLQKQCRANDRQLILLNPHPTVRRALSLMRLQDHFTYAKDTDSARILLQS